MTLRARDAVGPVDSRVLSPRAKGFAEASPLGVYPPCFERVRKPFGHIDLQPLVFGTAQSTQFNRVTALRRGLEAKKRRFWRRLDEILNS